MPTPKQFRRIAKELKKLKSNGLTQPTVLIKFTPGTPTPGERTRGNNPTSVEYACHAVPGRATKDKIGGTLVEKTDKVWLLPGKNIASAAVPSTTDQLRVDGVVYRIVGVEDPAAGAIYTLLTRL